METRPYRPPSRHRTTNRASSTPEVLPQKSQIRPSHHPSTAATPGGLTSRARKRADGVSCKQIIRDIGLKVTQQRLIILEQILAGRKHITAQEVFENVTEGSPDIGFATVYRFLRTLSDHGYITEVRMKGLPARYEWKSKEHHDHITCVECGRIAEFESSDIERLQIEVATSLGFELTDHILELYGVCRGCRVRIPKDHDSK